MWCHSKKLLPVIALLLFLFPAFSSAEAAVVEAEPDLQLVMGDLCALSVAMRLYYDDTHKTQCPSVAQLAHYFRKSPGGEDYRTAEMDGDWWVGRRVPDFSRARSFLRANAGAYGLFDRESMSHWLGGAFVWKKAVAFDRKGGHARAVDTFDLRVAQGDNRDNQHLFFNVPGTDRYWWSNLLYTTGAHAEALKKYASKDKGPFVIPQAPGAKAETVSASPVSAPLEFSVGPSSDDAPGGIEMGDVMFTPIPRSRD